MGLKPSTAPDSTRLIKKNLVNNKWVNKNKAIHALPPPDKIPGKPVMDNENKVG
jgi:hypothetical protein